MRKLVLKVEWQLINCSTNDRIRKPPIRSLLCRLSLGQGLSTDVETIRWIVDEELDNHMVSELCQRLQTACQGGNVTLHGRD